MAEDFLRCPKCGGMVSPSIVNRARGVHVECSVCDICWTCTESRHRMWRPNHPAPKPPAAIPATPAT